MRERILVSGGAGYIGSILVPELLREGYSVTVLDRFSEGNPVLANCCQFNGFKPVRGDVRDTDLMQRLVSRSDIIIPLAAVVGAPLCDRNVFDAMSINRDSIKALAKMVSRSQKVVFPNSNSGYGNGDLCTEETPLNPNSLYGKTKSEAEAAVLDLGHTVVYRLATVFGMSPRMRLDLLVNDFVNRALTDRAVIVFEGHFRRNYIHVRDVAKAFLHAIENYSKMRGEVYNVGLSSANLTKLQLCEKIKSVIPQFQYVESEIGEDPDKRDYVVSNRKLEMTGWRADWSLELGIFELVKGLTMLRNQRFGNV